ncbi:MAG: hypothetical protein HMLKMBBP_01991 [Planctomycetes bacterium]|nr:hypothetical protein [Planctomycetota bacterium]
MSASIRVGFAALLLLAPAGAGCSAEPAPKGGGAPARNEAGDDGFRPDPVPAAGDIRFTVTPAAASVPLGGNITFRCKVENTGKVKARVNTPRLSADSVAFRVRWNGAAQPVWVDRRVVKESSTGFRPVPPVVSELAPGGAVETDIPLVAVMSGKLTFSPVYTYQGAPQPLSAAPVEIDVTPDGDRTKLGLRIETSKGAIEALLRPDLAYNSVTHVAELASRGFYDGSSMHRMIQGFMAQGGSPKGEEGWGGPGWHLRRELHGKLRHERGTFSMARLGQPADSAGSQFYVCFAKAQNLDSGYTTFGTMISGEETLQALEKIAAPPDDPTGQGTPREAVTIVKASLFTTK